MKTYKCDHIRKIDEHLQPDVAWSTAFEDFTAIFLCDACVLSTTVEQAAKKAGRVGRK